MNNDGVLYKIWRIVYPLIIYFLLDVLIVWAAELLAVLNVSIAPGSFLAVNMPAIANIIFLAVSIIVMYKIYSNDHYSCAEWIYKKPLYYIVLIILGALASHGLSALVSLLNMDSIVGNYSEIEASVFAASPVLVVIQTVVLAPLSEELLFRGILFRRLESYIDGFWLPALISSAIFGLYHFNLVQGIFAFLFGILLCAVYVKIRNLTAVIVLHIGGNLISVVLVYTGFTYPEKWVYMASMCACLAASFAIYYFAIRPVKKWTSDQL